MKNPPLSRGSIVAALDIGSAKVACFIGRVVDNEGGFEILGVGNRPSAGVKSGAIVDLGKAEAAVRHAVHAAENMAAEAMKGYPLREVVVNVSGTNVMSHSHRAEIKIYGHEVTGNDVRRALVQAQQEALQEEHELIHTIPAGYQLDATDGIADPRGMCGDDLRVDIHLVTGEIGALRNMAGVVERSHLDISALCVSAYAAGLASLVEDEMDLGCTVIDMGGGTTSMAVFHGGAMIYQDAIPIGGNHVTGDIARGLVTSVDAAERLKKLYGSAMVTNMDDRELIDVPKLGEEPGGPVNHVSRAMLIGIIQPRLEEIFELLRARMKDSNLGGLIGRRVVLTGGACQLAGMRDLAAHVLDKQVRLGKPIRLNGLPDATAGPAYAATAGLLTYMAQRSAEMPAEIMAQAEAGSFWEGVRMWWRENW